MTQEVDIAKLREVLYMCRADISSRRAGWHDDRLLKYIDDALDLLQIRKKKEKRSWRAFNIHWAAAWKSHWVIMPEFELTEEEAGKVAAALNEEYANKIHPQSPLGQFFAATQEKERPEPRNGY